MWKKGDSFKIGGNDSHLSIAAEQSYPSSANDMLSPRMHGISGFQNCKGDKNRSLASG